MFEDFVNKEEDQPMSNLTKNSIMIIDDEKSNIIALTDILNTEYRVYAVRASLEAIEAAERNMPDVILLDIIMPEMDGYEVISELKSEKATADIPVIFITGLDDMSAEEKGLALGAADYITKPFHSSIVKLRVKNQVKILDQFRTIERLSLHDQLTGLPNRRNFETRMNHEWGRAHREKTPLSLLMIDIDNFKHYNDSFGHQQGDSALVTAAKTFRLALKRPGDFAVRWGGEEFIILLPNTNPDGAMEVAELLRRNVENTVIPGRIETKVTVSVGVRTWTYGQDVTIDELITNADTALYEAKRLGRNRVYFFPTSNIKR